MKSVENKKITVLGAARSGIASAILLKNNAAEVFVSDLANREKKADEISLLEKENIACEFGLHSDRVFESDFIVLSPGIPVESQIVIELRRRNIPVYSEIEVASWFCRAPIIGVTGSNGKTTTTTMIGEMLKKEDPNTIVGGNIGQPFSEYVSQSHQARWAVVELSSFQLETIDKFHPTIAVILNFAPNHLDRYRSYEEYIRAKWRVTNNLEVDDILIFNGNDIQLSEWAFNANCLRECFRLEIEDVKGAYYKNGHIFLHGEYFMSVDEMFLQGKHNYMNAMAAILVSLNAGIQKNNIIQVLKDFKGIEHRLEFVREWNSIRFFNDSKATTIESLYYALQSFNEQIILIAGGKDKGSDFSKLSSLIDKHVKSTVLIGSAAGKIETAWKNQTRILHANSMEEAVKLAVEDADKNEVVLLSPACASFDMFQDFEDRGTQFKAQVNGLA